MAAAPPEQAAAVRVADFIVDALHVIFTAVFSLVWFVLMLAAQLGRRLYCLVLDPAVCRVVLEWWRYFVWVCLVVAERISFKFSAFS